MQKRTRYGFLRQQALIIKKLQTQTLLKNGCQPDDSQQN
jgi:hypothetical protein